MLGIVNLYYIGAKGHIYIHVQVYKYAGNPLTGGETTIYKYTSNNCDANKDIAAFDERNLIQVDRGMSNWG
jgi:hypothetical protein